MNTNIRCQTCQDQGWVCEAHDTPNWEMCPRCEVHVGAPCKECNPCDQNNPPRDMPGFKVVLDDDGFHPHIIGGKDV